MVGGEHREEIHLPQSQQRAEGVSGTGVRGQGAAVFLGSPRAPLFPVSSLL